MYAHAHIRTAAFILNEYKGNIPFAAWLKDFFRQDKKYGSRDRRSISHLCYSFYRLGNAFNELDVTERILHAIFLTSTQPNAILAELKPEWNDAASLNLREKFVFLGHENEWQKIFPFMEKLSPGIDEEFIFSFLIQPDLYLRIRPGKEETVEQKLKDAGIGFSRISNDCISLENSSQVDKVLYIDNEAVIQDASSQRVLDPLKNVFNRDEKFPAWDCCAASGGKSILLYDLYPSVQLTVSDVRATIIENLKSRFKRAGIHKYEWFVDDVSAEDFKLKSFYDLVICDAPCSGSGTWSRTPEQLYTFEQYKITHYSSLQRKIVTNAIKQLNAGGYFIYITCSVFKEENEDMVDFIQRSTSLTLKTMQYIKGYTNKADTLFIALFRS